MTSEDAIGMPDLDRAAFDVAVAMTYGLDPSAVDALDPHTRRLMRGLMAAHRVDDTPVVLESSTPDRPPRRYWTTARDANGHEVPLNWPLGETFTHFALWDASGPRKPWWRRALDWIRTH
jgi:hypothetical protein